MSPPLPSLSQKDNASFDLSTHAGPTIMAAFHLQSCLHTSFVLTARARFSLALLACKLLFVCQHHYLHHRHLSRSIRALKPSYKTSNSTLHHCYNLKNPFTFSTYSFMTYLGTLTFSSSLHPLFYSSTNFSLTILAYALSKWLPTTTTPTMAVSMLYLCVSVSTPVYVHPPNRQFIPDLTSKPPFIPFPIYSRF